MKWANASIDRYWLHLANGTHSLSLSLPPFRSHSVFFFFLSLSLSTRRYVYISNLISANKRVSTEHKPCSFTFLMHMFGIFVRPGSARINITINMCTVQSNYSQQCVSTCNWDCWWFFFCFRFMCNVHPNSLPYLTLFLCEFHCSPGKYSKHRLYSLFIFLFRLWQYTTCTGIQRRKVFVMEMRWFHLIFLHFFVQNLKKIWFNLE